MSNAAAELFWLARPTANSITMTGRPKMTRNTRYMSTNAAPPYSPVMYGKRHTLPKPMAHPAEIKMKPKREPNRSRLATPAPATFAAPAPLPLLIPYLSR